MSIDNVEKFVARYGRKAHEQSQEVPEHLYPHMWRHYGECFKMGSDCS